MTQIDWPYAFFWLLLITLAASILALLLWPRLIKRGDRKVGVGLWLGSLAFAIGLYALVGAPQLVRQWQWEERARLAAESALATLKQRSESEAQNPEAWIALGEAQLRAGRMEEAVASFKKEALLSAGNPESLLRLGKAQVLAAGGRVNSDAARTFTMLQHQRPNPQAELFLAMHEAEIGNTAQARIRLKNLAERTDNPPEVRAAAKEQLTKLK